MNLGNEMKHGRYMYEQSLEEEPQGHGGLSCSIIIFIFGHGRMIAYSPFKAFHGNGSISCLTEANAFI